MEEGLRPSTERVLQKRTERFERGRNEYSDEGEPNLEKFYGTLWSNVRRVARGYWDFLILDADGGLGKTHNVRRVLEEELDRQQWTHKKGFTTPLELYKTLWDCRDEGSILFLDDMSGVRSAKKAIELLKAATDTHSDENWVSYNSSQEIEHKGMQLPNEFSFRGSVIMSFNGTPDTARFQPLKDRASVKTFELSFDQRISLIQEVAKIASFSELTISEQRQIADWIEAVADHSMDVSLRTFEEVCGIYHFGKSEDDIDNWKQMAYEVFDIDYEMFLIIQLRFNSGLPVEEQIRIFNEETGHSGNSYYYDLVSDLKSRRE